jgi:hypothetical protein
MTDTSKLQALFEAALRDSSDFIGRMPKPAAPPCNPAVHRPATTVPVRAGFKPVMGTAGASHGSAEGFLT